MRSFYRPFELLKLIRDGVITNVQDLRGVPDSEFYHFTYAFRVELSKLGIIKVDREGSMKTTARWDELAAALNLSLSKLSQYDEDSVVCAPAFGKPGKPPVEAEVFVVMPFTDEMKPVYEDPIKAVTSALGLTVSRADDFFSADSIIGDVWNAINASRIVIADCTGRNPNVFYEMGVAHTLGKPVILIAQTIDDVPFDVMHLRTIVYDFKPRGMQQFESALRSTLEHELATPHSLEEFIRQESR